MLYLVQLYDEWVDFRLAELRALLVMNGLSWDAVVRTDIAADNTTSTEDRQFYVLELPNEGVVRAICSRAILVKAIYELWSCGKDLRGAIEATVALKGNFIDQYLQSEASWSVSVNTFGRALSMDQKQDCRLHFKFLEFPGPVNVVSPEMDLTITLDYTKFRHVTAETVLAPEERSLIRQVRTDVPTYFGRLIARGGMKEVLRVHDLKKRLYLGPTSLDDSLALILANISGVQRGMLAYDPFVGTASILVALTQLGCVCTGSDIDPRVLRGEMHAGTTSGDEAPAKGTTAAATAASATRAGPAAEDSATTGPPAKKHAGVAEATAKRVSKHNAAKRNIFANFRAYSLPLPELIRMDNHLFDRHINLVNTGMPGELLHFGPLPARCRGALCLCSRLLHSCPICPLLTAPSSSIADPQRPRATST
jgi:tRNA G10  N-methylase Trm11